MVVGMMTWDSIISALGKTSELTGAFGQTASTVSGWRVRGIPAAHWAAVVALASANGRPEITLEVLAALAARKFEDART